MAAPPRFMFQRFGRRVVAVQVEVERPPPPRPRVQRWCEPCEVGWVGDTPCWSPTHPGREEGGGT